MKENQNFTRELSRLKVLSAKKKKRITKTRYKRRDVTTHSEKGRTFSKSQPISRNLEMRKNEPPCHCYACKQRAVVSCFTPKFTSYRNITLDEIVSCFPS
eukprot:GEMP01114380.1.p1 GENE.GEMP01114380.1~~GEMP01114380.1.p1  ORF type:complete len:100 (-),score=2.96 GEMP01114380.1:96-395(-)